METKEEIKQQIIEKAEERFCHYGFHKTTMAEIAKECDMSAANLYRYFKNKEEIGAYIGKQCMERKGKIIREILNRPGVNASQLLEDIVVAELRYLLNEGCHRPKIIELVEFISQHRPDIFETIVDKKKSVIAEVLAKGNASGEFDVGDIVTTAETIITATMRFWLIYLFAIFNEPIEEVEQQARNLIRLLIRGLLKR